MHTNIPEDTHTVRIDRNDRNSADKQNKCEENEEKEIYWQRAVMYRKQADVSKYIQAKSVFNKCGFLIKLQHSSFQK